MTNDFTIQLHSDKSSNHYGRKYWFTVPSASPTLDSNAHWQVAVKSIFFSGYINIFDEDSFIMLEKFNEHHEMVDSLQVFPKLTTFFFKPDNVASALNTLFSGDKVSNFLKVGTVLP